MIRDLIKSSSFVNESLTDMQGPREEHLENLLNEVDKSEIKSFKSFYESKVDINNATFQAFGNINENINSQVISLYEANEKKSPVMLYRNRPQTHPQKHLAFLAELNYIP